MIPRHSWGSMSRKSRDTAARTAAQKYGLSRQSARRMYNRGTFRPFAREAEQRVPQAVKRNPERYLPPDRQGGNFLSLREKALNSMLNMKAWLLENDPVRAIKFNSQAVTQRIGEMTPEQLRWTANAMPEEIMERAARKSTVNPWHYH